MITASAIVLLVMAIVVLAALDASASAFGVDSRKDSNNENI